MPQTERYPQQLARQLAFMERSAAAFDQGFKDEAVRIATSCRILFHNTRSQTSLLTRMKASDAPLLSTCEEPSPNAIIYHGMGLQTISSSGASFRAALGDGPPPVNRFMPVTQWWEQVVFIPGQAHRLTRGAIAINAADKDGGAHVDPTLTAEYEALINASPMLWYSFGSNVLRPAPVPEAHFVCLRQMAYEVLNSPALRQLAHA